MFLKNKILIILLCTSGTYTFAQNDLYGGIEIGSKGIKMTVLEVDNIKRGNYTKIDSWSENIGIAKGISIDGKLAPEDIEKAAQVVITNLTKIRKVFKVVDKNIFVVGSSGVAMATNTDDLVKSIRKDTNKELVFIDAQTEGKMLLKGCIPAKQYATSMVLDIGGGNTKGGYVDIDKDEFIFFPLSLNYGTITLTESVLKKTKSINVSEFTEKSFEFLPILRNQIQEMYNTKPEALEKENVYLSGGAAWAFYTLTNGESKTAFSLFKLEDVLYYDAVLKNNFQKYELLAETDKEVARVLKTYSQKYLISASNLLLVCLEAIPKISNKKLYFAKEGQIAWLVSYVVDRAKNIKKIK